jgi:hypothetical protein
MFWTPAFAGVTIQGIFYEIIKVAGRLFSPVITSITSSKGIPPKGGLLSPPSEEGCREATQISRRLLGSEFLSV